MYSVPPIRHPHGFRRIALALLAGVAVSGVLFALLREPLTGVPARYLIMPRWDNLLQQMFVYGVYGLGSLTAVAIYPHSIRVSILNTVVSYSAVLLVIERYRPEGWELIPRGYVRRYGELIVLACVVHLSWNAIQSCIRSLQRRGESAYL